MKSQQRLLPPVEEALRLFPQIFQTDATGTPSCGAAWAPGRVNLIGEHTDYNGGFVLPLAVDRVAVFAGCRRADQHVRLWSTQFSAFAELALEDLPATFELQRSALPSWARYILGVLTELARGGFPLRGFDAVVSGDVPLGGGMSSSAALEVATVQACLLFSSDAWSDTLSPLQIAALCQRAEHISSGVRSGILDQAASCLGQPQKAVLIDCRSLEYRYLPFDAPDLSLVVIDTSVRRELAASAYNERRNQCEEATRLLRDLLIQHEPESTQARTITLLRDITPQQFARYQDALPELLRRRAGYVIAENERVLQCVRLLEAGHVEEVGTVLWQGHAGLRDEYEVSCLELDVLVDIAHLVPGVLGARMMGGGFGGCTINLVRNSAIPALREAVALHYPERTGRQAGFDICRAAAGPGYTWHEAAV